MMNLALALAAGGSMGDQLPVWSIAPFALILLSIAVLPLVAHHWWESNRNKAIVSFSLAIPFVAWLWTTFPEHAGGALTHSVLEYVSFLCLLGALYIISGGIYLRGSLNGTPGWAWAPCRMTRSCAMSFAARLTLRVQSA